MEFNYATELVVRKALRRLAPGARLDPMLLQEHIAEVIKEQGETIFTQLDKAARQQLRMESLRINEQISRLGRIEQAIDYGHLLIAKYGAVTFGKLSEGEQRKFARLWADATGGVEFPEN